MWIADILVALMGLYGVFGIAAGIWSIRHRHERQQLTIKQAAPSAERAKDYEL